MPWVHQSNCHATRTDVATLSTITQHEGKATHVCHADTVHAARLSWSQAPIGPIGTVPIILSVDRFDIPQLVLDHVFQTSSHAHRLPCKE